MNEKFDLADLTKLERLEKENKILKEKLIIEKSYHLYYLCQGDCERVVCSAGSHKQDAINELRRMLPEIDW